MKYGIDYRYLPKGGSLPVDNTQPVDVEVDHDQFALIPNVGDFVDFPGRGPGHAQRAAEGQGPLAPVQICDELLLHHDRGREDSDDDWNKIRAHAMDT